MFERPTNAAIDRQSKFVTQPANQIVIKANVVCPQIENICRSEGARLGAIELLVGQSRQAFPTKTSERFKAGLDKKGIAVLNGLIRHSYIPQKLRKPTQEGSIANGLKLTREREDITNQAMGKLEKAEAEVNFATDTTEAETKKLVAPRLAEGGRDAEEITAKT